MSNFKINGVSLLDSSDRSRQVVRKVIQNSPDVVWTIFQQIVTEDEHGSLLKAFPFEEFSESYLKIMMKDPHITSCTFCSSHVTNRRTLYGVNAKVLTLSNCHQHRRLAIDYDDVKLTNRIDEFIVERFAEACKQNEVEFVSSVAEEHILKFIQTVGRGCNIPEFDAIVTWFRSDPDRKVCFDHFISAEDGDNPFKKSLRNLCQIENETMLSKFGKMLGTSDNEPRWLVSPNNCSFVRYLADTEHCKHTQKRCDIYIQQHIREVSVEPDVSHLPLEAIKRYVANESYYGDGDSIWTLVKKWLHYRKDVESRCASQIVNSMLLRKLCIHTLEDYCKHPIVRESVTCHGNVLEVVLMKVARMHSSHAELEKKLAGYESKLSEIAESNKRESETIETRRKMSDVWKAEVNSRLAGCEAGVKVLSDMQSSLANVEKHYSDRMSGLEKRIAHAEALMKKFGYKSGDPQNSESQGDRYVNLHRRLEAVELMLSGGGGDHESRPAAL